MNLASWIAPPRSLARLAALATGLSVLACTCNDPLPRGTTGGELGNGTFAYRCVDDTDAACPGDGAAAADFPSCIAVGGRFQVRYDASAIGSGAVVDSPTSLVEADGAELVAVAPGYAAIVAWDGDALLDVVHLAVEEPSELAVEVEAAVLELDAQTGLRAREVGDEGELCAGAMPYAWSVEPTGVVAIGGEPNDRVHLVAIGAGVATVTVSDGAREASVEVEVAGDPAESTGDTSEPTGATGDTGGAP